MRIAVLLTLAVLAAPCLPAAEKPVDRAPADAARLMKDAFRTGDADLRTALVLTQWVMSARPDQITPVFVEVLRSAGAEGVKSGDPAWDQAAEAIVSTFVRLMQDGPAHRRHDTDAVMRDLAPVLTAVLPAIIQALADERPAAREGSARVPEPDQPR